MEGLAVNLLDDAIICSACTAIVPRAVLGAPHVLAEAESSIRGGIVIHRSEHGVFLPRTIVTAISKLRLPWVFEFADDVVVKDRLVAFALDIEHPDDWPAFFRGLEARYGYRYPHLSIR